MEFAFQLTQLLHARDIYKTDLVYKVWDYAPKDWDYPPHNPVM